MIKVTDKNGVPTPAVLPICPSTCKVASVVLNVNRSTFGNRFGANVTLLDSDNAPVPFDRKSVRPMTDAEIVTALATPAIAGDTLDEDIERRILPYLTAAFGITGVSQK